MRNLGLGRCALNSCVAAAMLAGCGAQGSTAPPIGTSSSMGHAVSVQSSTSGYAVLHSFGDKRDGGLPYAAVTALNGRLFGTTVRGGYTVGTVYKLTTGGDEKVLYRFKNLPDAEEPEANLLPVNGTLYGTAFSGGGGSAPGAIFSVTPDGSEHVVYGFKKPPDVSSPTAGLVELGGKLYGMAEFGGASQDYGGDFELTPSGKERVLHRFTGAPGDGGRASANLIVVNRVLYGVTEGGGAHDDGAVFSLTPSGVERVLYSFKGGTKDGALPNALTVLNGTLFGTTRDGGDGTCEQGCGTIFALKIGGGERVIHEFKLQEGVKPSAGLVAYNGELYGTTCAGGLYGSGNSCWAGTGFQAFGLGSVFRVSTGGAFTVLHLFGGSNDGETPMAPLIALNGELYGTTENGGSYSGGTAFRISP